MTTDDEFLAAINAAPDELALRLVYADWLEEQGRAVAAERERMVAKYGCYENAALDSRDRKQCWGNTGRPGHASWKESRRRQWRGR
jgi:uncharacterized protein (TIGR02996 family)